MKKACKLGDRVQLKAKAHNWHTKHIVEVFEVPGRHEFQKKNYEEIALLLGSKARRTKLKGTVKGFGMGDDEFKDRRPYVFVEFKWKDMVCDFYCSEHELKRL